MPPLVVAAEQPSTWLQFVNENWVWLLIGLWLCCRAIGSRIND